MYDRPNGQGKRLPEAAKLAPQHISQQTSTFRPNYTTPPCNTQWIACQSCGKLYLLATQELAPCLLI